MEDEVEDDFDLEAGEIRSGGITNGTEQFLNTKHKHVHARKNSLPVVRENVSGLGFKSGDCLIAFNDLVLDATDDADAEPRHQHSPPSSRPG